MLLFGRRKNEVVISVPNHEPIKIIVCDIDPLIVRLGFEAPKHIAIDRSEICNAKRNEMAQLKPVSEIVRDVLSGAANNELDMIDRAFGRGYDEAIEATLNAVEAGASREDLANFANAVGAWRDGGSHGPPPSWQIKHPTTCPCGCDWANVKFAPVQNPTPYKCGRCNTRFGFDHSTVTKMEGAANG